MNIIFWSMASQGKGISGGDRIYIEFAKNWSKKNNVEIVTWREGIEMMRRNGLNESSKIKFVQIDIPKRLLYISRIFISIAKACLLVIEKPTDTLLYSSSEFWMDTLPCAILKIRYKKLLWIASWYQTAPSPISGYAQGRYRSRAILYWLVQLPIKPLIELLSDVVLINNEDEKKQFVRPKKIVVLGAVNTNLIEDYLHKYPKHEEVFDAVFQGRFHPQKGIVELIDIWSLVVQKEKKAKLCIIGDGPLRKKVEEKIDKYKLSKNIEMKGYLFDGKEKFDIFAKSKLVVHPAYYDSGGMAAAEAMAFDIPCVGFDLESYKSYYPVGMVKVEKNNIQKFSDTIVDLLINSKKRCQLGSQAGEYIRSHYTWEYRANNVLEKIHKVI